jgi:hypothetical protein
MQRIADLLQADNYDKNAWEFEHSCVICRHENREEYKPNQYVVKLPCSKQHITHAICFFKHVDAGKSFCPYCRETLPLSELAMNNSEESQPSKFAEEC